MRSKRPGCRTLEPPLIGVVRIKPFLRASCLPVGYTILFAVSVWSHDGVRTTRRLNLFSRPLLRIISETACPSSPPERCGSTSSGGSRNFFSHAAGAGCLLQRNSGLLVHKRCGTISILRRPWLSTGWYRAVHVKSPFCRFWQALLTVRRERPAGAAARGRTEGRHTEPQELPGRPVRTGRRRRGAGETGRLRMPAADDGARCRSAHRAGVPRHRPAEPLSKAARCRRAPRVDTTALLIRHCGREAWRSPSVGACRVPALRSPAS